MLWFDIFQNPLNLLALYALTVKKSTQNTIKKGLFLHFYIAKKVIKK